MKATSTSDVVGEAFDTCLYALLNLPPRGTRENKALTPEDIRKAYRLAALDFHPDKNDSQEAREMFVQIGSAYQVLRDPKLRREYDRTGLRDPQTLGRSQTTRSEDWVEVFRNMFEEVSADEVASFYKTYIGSIEEVEDTIRAYEQCKGDFEAMVTRYCMFPNEAGQVSRLLELCTALIEQGKLRDTVAFRRMTTPVALKKIEAYLTQERELAEVEAGRIATSRTASSKRQRSNSKDSNGNKNRQLSLFHDQVKFEAFLEALGAKYESIDTEGNDDEEITVKSTRKKKVSRS